MATTSAASPASPSSPGNRPVPPWGRATDAARNVFDSLAVQLRDVVERSGAPGVVVDASDGLGSAVVCALASHALGPQRVWALALPGPTSSPRALADADEVARNLGIRLDVVPITSPHDAVVATMRGLAFRGLPGTGVGGAAAAPGAISGVRNEPLEAIVRGTVLAAVSDVFGPLPLATIDRTRALLGSPRSHADPAGALAPLGGCYRTGPGGVHDLARLVDDRAGAAVVPARLLGRWPTTDRADLRVVLEGGRHAGGVIDDDVLDLRVLDDGVVDRGLLDDGVLDDGVLDPELLDDVLRALVDDDRSADAVAAGLGVHRAVVHAVAERVREHAARRPVPPAALHHELVGRGGELVAQGREPVGRDSELVARDRIRRWP
jgi:NH3-dependent NAD+ synthetase